jgi:hypothetical protein
MHYDDKDDIDGITKIHRIINIIICTFKKLLKHRYNNKSMKIQHFVGEQKILLWRTICLSIILIIIIVIIVRYSAPKIVFKIIILLFFITLFFVVDLPYAVTQSRA